MDKFQKLRVGRSEATQKSEGTPVWARCWCTERAGSKMGAWMNSLVVPLLSHDENVSHLESWEHGSEHMIRDYILGEREPHVEVREAIRIQNQLWRGEKCSDGHQRVKY